MVYKCQILSKMDFNKTNLAVIKSKFLQMDEQTFKANMEILYNQLLDLELTPRTSNYRYALINLYKWCIEVYRQRFQQIKK